MCYFWYKDTVNGSILNEWGVALGGGTIEKIVALGDGTIKNHKVEHKHGGAGTKQDWNTHL